MDVYATEDGYVTWMPPVMSPEELAGARFIIFGRTEGHVEPLGGSTFPNVTARVRGGFHEYGVQVEVGGKLSAITFAVAVRSCLRVEPKDPIWSGAPGVRNECRIP